MPPGDSSLAEAWVVSFGTSGVVLSALPSQDDKCMGSNRLLLARPVLLNLDIALYVVLVISLDNLEFSAATCKVQQHCWGML